MDLGKVLTELRAELENLNAAILSLERLQKTDPKKRRISAAELLRADAAEEKGPLARVRGRAAKI